MLGLVHNLQPASLLSLLLSPPTQQKYVIACLHHLSVFVVTTPGIHTHSGTRHKPISKACKRLLLSDIFRVLGFAKGYTVWASSTVTGGGRTCFLHLRGVSSFSVCTSDISRVSYFVMHFFFISAWLLVLTRQRQPLSRAPAFRSLQSRRHTKPQFTVIFFLLEKCISPSISRDCASLLSTPSFAIVISPLRFSGYVRVLSLIL